MSVERAAVRQYLRRQRGQEECERSELQRIHLNSCVRGRHLISLAGAFGGNTKNPRNVISPSVLFHHFTARIMFFALLVNIRAKCKAPAASASGSTEDASLTL